MASGAKTYLRLPGRGANLVQYFTLYEGPDHLLLVTSSGFSENYKRFFYREIQGFILQKTSMNLVWSGIWTSFIVIFTAAAIASDGATFIALASIAGFFLLLLVWNLILGPSCKCYVRTAVQVERLPNFKRIHKTREVLTRIENLIALGQGAFTASGAAENISQAEPEAPPVITPEPEVRSESAPPTGL